MARPTPARRRGRGGRRPRSPLLHLGFIIVGVPYSTPGMLHTAGRGGTPYGATTVAGPGNDLSPAPEDLVIARALGQRVAEITQKLRG